MLWYKSVTNQWKLSQDDFNEFVKESETWIFSLLALMFNSGIIRAKPVQQNKNNEAKQKYQSIKNFIIAHSEAIKHDYLSKNPY